MRYHIQREGHPFMPGFSKAAGIRRRLPAVTILINTSLCLTGLCPTALPADNLDLPPQAKAPSAINSQSDLIAWMTYYYLHPQPDLLVPGILLADKQGLLDDTGRAPLMAFVSQVFSQNPGKIKTWSEQLQALKPTSKSLLYTALYWSPAPEARETLDKIIQTLPEKAQAELKTQTAHPAEPIEKMDITTPAVLDELWGSFCATGDERYVNRLLTVLPWCDSDGKDLMKLMIGGAAKWSLTSNAEQHPRVMSICLKARDCRPELKKVLTEVIEKAQTRSQASSKAGEPTRK